MKSIRQLAHVALATAALGSFLAPSALAHCDAMDGPIVVEAQAAFQAGELAPTLKWITPAQSAELSEAFQKARALAEESRSAAGLAERWFLETLVRLHRESEGAPYTGLKPAGQTEPAVALADAALEDGSAEALANRIGSAVSRAILERFHTAAERQSQAAESVESGRAFVAAYVDYVHLVEAVHALVHHGAAHAH